MTDPRYESINELFIQFSLGNFDYRVEVSDKLDEIDAFISNVNMLGEELKEKTISKEYFNDIFNSVSDLVFVFNIQGKIQRVNRAVVFKLGLSENELMDLSIDELFEFENQSTFKFDDITEKLDNKADLQLSFIYRDEKFPTLCSFSKLVSNNDEHVGFILVLKDITNIRELETTLMISEEKYHKLFEESNDAIMIINNKGKIIELNSVGKDLLGITSSSQLRNGLFHFMPDITDRKFVQAAILNQKNLNNGKIVISKISGEKTATCYISINKISRSDFYQVILKDITEQIELENLVIRTITDTQEKERIRLARDIHDSLGQQLSAIKFYLATLNSISSLDDKYKRLLEKSEEGIKQVLASTREICFNLIPQTIENFGLVAAVEELCKNSGHHGLVNFTIRSNKDVMRMTIEKEISIFRIIQEFINNSIKHSHAKNIRINFTVDEKGIKVVLKDDGIGFDLNKILIGNQGMGLKNVVSRAKSHNGDLKIQSRPGSGVKYNIFIPF